MNQSEYEEAKRTIEPTDATLRNTVRTINGLSDATTQTQLERFFAGQLVDIARRLREPEEVAALVKKIQDLAGEVSARTHITPRHLDQYRKLIARERPDAPP